MLLGDFDALATLLTSRSRNINYWIMDERHFYSVAVFRSRTLYQYSNCTSTYLYNVLGNTSLIMYKSNNL